MYWFISPCGHGADWELLLPVVTQHHKKVWYCILLAWEKIKIQSTVSTECLSLLHHHKVKIRKLKHCMLETVVHAVIYICIRLCPFVQFMKFSWQVYWGCLPFPPPQDHVLSEVSSMTRLSWVALHGMAHSFMSYASPFTTTRQWSVKCIKLEENNRRGKTLFRKIRNIKGTFCLKMGTIKDRNG